MEYMSSHCSVSRNIAAVGTIQTDYEPLQKDRLGKEPEKLAFLQSATGSPNGTRLNMAELGPRKRENLASDS